MNGPREITTERLILRPPGPPDIGQIFERYASDALVGKYLAWPMHQTLDDTRGFVEFSDAEWQRWPAGPYLILSARTGTLLGSTGLGFESPRRATTGYVLARDSWGRGIATEATAAMQRLATQLELETVRAYCHPEHLPSRRVLEKCGFELAGSRPGYCEFPNLQPGVPTDVLCYSWKPTADRSPSGH